MILGRRLRVLVWPLTQGQAISVARPEFCQLAYGNASESGIQEGSFPAIFDFDWISIGHLTTTYDYAIIL